MWRADPVWAALWLTEFSDEPHRDPRTFGQDQADCGTYPVCRFAARVVQRDGTTFVEILDQIGDSWWRSSIRRVTVERLGGTQTWWATKSVALPWIAAPYDAAGARKARELFDAFPRRIVQHAYCLDASRKWNPCSYEDATACGRIGGCLAPGATDTPEWYR